jgi:hypothetical protein
VKRIRVKPAVGFRADRAQFTLQGCPLPSSLTSRQPTPLLRSRIFAYMKKLLRISSFFAVSTQESNIATARAEAAKCLVISNYLTLIEDFFSAAAAIHSASSSGDQCLEIDE